MGKVLRFQRNEQETKKCRFEGHEKGLLDGLPEPAQAQLYQLAQRRGMDVEDLMHELAMTGIANIVRRGT